MNRLFSGLRRRAVSDVSPAKKLAKKLAKTPAKTPVQKKAPRILFYSHDTFGLGHLRRSTAIAKALVANIPDASALIATGSPVAGRFALPPCVDFVRLPGVVKLPDGLYASQNLGLDIDEVAQLRADLLETAARSFKPDLLIVDKEPTGFRGELAPTLHALRSSSDAKVVLGLRDVLDEPEALATEWKRKGALPVAENSYDEIWVYGAPEMCNPLAGIAISRNLKSKIHYTGYLPRVAQGDGGAATLEQPFILVTPGGGGDGAGLVDWVLSAYECDPDLRPRAVIVYGPFLSGDERAAFSARAENLGKRIEVLTFVSNMEAVQERAMGVVAMGGYNTFCEILSANKPSVLAPRTKPRREQDIRALAAEKLGLLRRLDRKASNGAPGAMAAAIRALANQQPPSIHMPTGFLAGFDTIVVRAKALLPQYATPSIATNRENVA